ncbi:response regulator [Cycloclasticus pugetii]|uniref:response regulator n=1 Tax=Cycloclasticus pugetii TaxID=34068 RepID=UPI002409F91A|nr:response regulator [Cycloclasticus pugetii]MDF1830526.1 response regulator [Cycloclasticus pugetii]
MTKRMLAFSKQKSTEAEAEAVDVNSLVDDQKDLINKSLTAMITVHYQLCESLGLIWIDKSELEDSLLNLVINSKHAMPDGGQLTVSTGAVHLSQIEAETLGLTENDYITLSVKDNGCGIDKDIVDFIFDPFFTTKGIDGTGLGLSQVYGFAGRSGGTIKVYSEKGIGSEFTLYFPLYRGEERNDTGPIEVKPYRQGEGQGILVVDDEPALRKLALEILTLAGYQVLLARNGNEAIEMLATTKFDLVLSDVIMPQMDGYQLAKHIKENYPSIKVQLATGFSSNRHSAMKDKSLQNNMLYKPYRTGELLRRVSTLIYGNDDD